MIKLIDTISLDTSGEYEKAVKAYDQIAAEGNAPIEVFTNLAFIYWELVTQFTSQMEAQSQISLKVQVLKTIRKSYE